MQKEWFYDKYVLKTTLCMLLADVEGQPNAPILFIKECGYFLQKDLGCFESLDDRPGQVSKVVISKETGSVVFWMRDGEFSTLFPFCQARHGALCRL